ncbi:phosphopyruvate hydratase [Candidatus Uhrbacteria bacterium]|nr:phosphopyruvate hydratase [Candidatus Uhrbacteria bacterium]
MKIKKIIAREILDSRGNPTVEARVTLANGVSAVASVPSGASTGSHEALELRDGVNRYGGKGVLKAVANVNGAIARALKGKDVREQRMLDETMLALDGTKNKSQLGANAILAVSLACARTAALASKLPLYRYLRITYNLQLTTYRLPLATMNVLNGGVHAGWSVDFQESMIIPRQKTFRERVRCGSEVFQALKGILKEKGFATTVGDEGGFAPHLKRNAETFAYIASAIKKAGYRLGTDVGIGMDPASSEFFDPKTRRYVLKADKKKFTAEEMVAYYSALLKKYPILFLEDGCAEDDWDGWKILTETLGKKVSLVGDDLFVTNVERLQKGIRAGVANAILIKVNQIGSLTETMDAICLAQAHHYKVAVSHRSGETADTFIADLAVAVNADYIKTGSLSRSERLEKYNRLMEIEMEL